MRNFNVPILYIMFQKCPPVLHNLMVNCWANEPNLRPSMDTVCRRLHDISSVIDCRSYQNSKIKQNDYRRYTCTLPHEHSPSKLKRYTTSTDSYEHNLKRKIYNPASKRPSYYQNLKHITRDGRHTISS